MNISEIILQGLESEAFREWYEGKDTEPIDVDSDFINFIRGDEGCKDRTKILEDIKRMFDCKLDEIVSDLVELCEDNDVMKEAIKNYFSKDQR